MKTSNIQYFFWIHILFASANTKENNNNNCEKCVNIADCPAFAHLSNNELKLLLEQVPCKQATPLGSRVASASENNYVCCPTSSTWKNKNNEGTKLPNSQVTKTIIKRSPSPDENWENENDLPVFYKNDFSRRHQCINASLLPKPESLCCGISASFLDDSDTDSPIDVFPWSAFLSSVFKNDKNMLSIFSCEGALISRQYILTAAHCVKRPKVTLERVNVTLARYGSDCGLQPIPHNPYETVPECLTNMLVENVIVHENFQSEKLIHDIALIKLKDYTSEQYIAPICLPNFNVDDNDLADEPLIVGGWDRARNVPYARDLLINEDNLIKLATLVYRVPYDECRINFYPILSLAQICAVSRSGVNVREGDSGGPLMMLRDKNYYLVGIVSATKDVHGGKPLPSLYTNVYRHFSWINNNIKN